MTPWSYPNNRKDEAQTVVMAATNGPPLRPLRPVLSIIVQEVEAHGISTLGMLCRKSALIWGQFSQPVRVYEAFDPRPKCVGVDLGNVGDIVR